MWEKKASYLPLRGMVSHNNPIHIFSVYFMNAWSWPIRKKYFTQKQLVNSMHAVILHAFVVVCWFFSKLTFSKNSFTKLSDCQKALIQIRTDVLPVLTEVQTVCLFCRLLSFFSKSLKKILSGVPSECQTVWIQVRLVWVNTVCKVISRREKSSIAGDEFIIWIYNLLICFWVPAGLGCWFLHTVNSEIFKRILFSQKALKDIFAT